MKQKVLVAARSFAHSEEAKAVLEAAGYELYVNKQDRPLNEAEMIQMIKGMDAIIVGNDEVTSNVIQAGLPTLKVIAKHGVGYNNIDVASAKQQGIPVTITPGANSKSVADLAMGLMLAIARRIPLMDHSVRSGSWKRVTGNELNGKTLGILGMGHIGMELAKRARGFEMKIIAYDVYQNQEVVEQYGVRYLPLPEVLKQADFVSLHVPSIPETINMINRNTLRTMKPTAYLINTARGDLIVEEDLAEALSKGIIAGAALDTFTHEPLSNDSKLRGLPNIVLTPHAGANTQEAVVSTGTMAAEEVIRVLSGGTPKHNVAR